MMKRVVAPTPWSHNRTAYSPLTTPFQHVQFTSLLLDQFGGGQVIGSNPVKITARSTEAADAVIKELLVEPEGIEVEIVGNHVISDGHHHEFHTILPFDAIDGSGLRRADG